MTEYTILLRDSITFTGKYRRDLETDNWHYYEQDNGTILHFRKEHMVFVQEKTAADIKKSK